MSLPYLKQLKSNLKIMLQARGGVHLWPGSFLAGGLIEGESIKHGGFLLEQALLVHSGAPNHTLVYWKYTFATGSDIFFLFTELIKIAP